jgi:Maltose acetyltransferase
MDGSIEWQKAQWGELYHAFVPELVKARSRCTQACAQFSNAAIAEWLAHPLSSPNERFYED